MGCLGIDKVPVNIGDYGVSGTADSTWKKITAGRVPFEMVVAPAQISSSSRLKVCRSVDDDTL